MDPRGDELSRRPGRDACAVEPMAVVIPPSSRTTHWPNREATGILWLMGLDGDAVRDGASNPFAAPVDGAPRADQIHEPHRVPSDGLSLARRRRRALGWSLASSVVGVPLMTYLAFGLARVTTPANETPEPWWIWFSAVVAALAVLMVASVLLGRWTLGRNLAFALMLPGVAMCLLLIWAFFFGLVFLPGALVWVPAFVVCLRMPAHERLAGMQEAATRRPGAERT